MSVTARVNYGEESKAMNAVNDAEWVPQNRGLMLEEGLLIDQSVPGRCGVDIAESPGTENRTGQERRTSIGLPQVTEPQVVRHFVRLSQQNYSIDSGVFPLGSCTMKHNPRQNEKMARMPGFALIHPFQPESSVQGAIALMMELEHWLATLSGLPGVSLAPAAGAHGELAGMMVIRAAHEAKGNPRKKVLVPDSAHGTNPATAATCGYTIVTIPTNAKGHVDLAEVEAAMDDEVAAFMLTNPNTAGKFEPDVKKVADLLHAHGAYFYCDGANFNAIAGRVRPADFGVDVMHFNLHKTFSTPHGGGGPGHGPIAVTEELTPFLPIPRFEKDGNGYHIVDNAPQSVGRIKGFHGHFGMAVRALSYMLAHGSDGIRQASEDAVLNANYVLACLRDLYHAPFEGSCMHECLLTDKKQRQMHDISTMDIAKALVEYGYHPMTVYFPLVVQGAMLIEPTESETKAALDEFIATMRYIAKEAEKDPVRLKNMPFSTPRRRLDEVSAAKKPVLSWQARNE